MSNQNHNSYGFQQVFIVEASAGSGKTYCLAKRYVQLLLNPKASFSRVPFENILAITFSNKATLEMKERVLEFLKKIALDSFSRPGEKEDILSSLGISEEQARQRASLMVETLLKNYNFFQIQTIDSFINAILSSCAYQLGLSANFKIKMDYKDDLFYSLDRLIDRASGDKKVLSIFHNFLSQYIYLERKTGWFPKDDIKIIMNDLFLMSNSYGEPFWRFPVEASDLLALKRAILDKMRFLRDHLPQGTHALFEKNLSDFLTANADTFVIADISDFFARERFPITKKGRLTSEIEGVWCEIRHSLRRLCEAESGAVFNAYVDIFKELSGELRSLCMREDVLFVQELSSRAQVLFQEGAVTVAELYYRMAARVRHFLIDEFQDTSRLQWNNLFLLVEEALSSGGSLFYVGDKKQAIYRFRGADSRLFDAVRAQFSSSQAVSTVLKDNYRSRRHIVDFCNDLFSESNLRRFLTEYVDAKKKSVFSQVRQDEIIEIFKGARQNHVDALEGGYVRMESFDCMNKDDKLDQIRDRFLRLMDDLAARFDYCDIAVLTRDNDKVELLTQWLLEHGIPVESEKTLNIRNNRYIKEIISFLKFLHSPIDDLFFASFIIGDIFAKATGLKREAFHSFIFQLRQKERGDKRSYLYREFRMNFPGVWEEFLAPFFKNVGFVPVYELTVSIYAKFRCLENFSQYQGFFMKLLELMRSEEEVSFSLGQFLDYFDRAQNEELYAAVSEMDSVKVSTIHKAKGLGFGVVVLPFLEMKVKKELRVVTQQDDSLILRRISDKHKMFSASLQEARDEDFCLSFIDELNNIYVALTRAKNELCIFVPRTHKRLANLAALLMPQEAIEKGEKRSYKKRPSPSAHPSVFNLGISCYRDWVGYLKEEFIDLESLKNRDKLLFGDVAHSILSGIGNCYHRDWQDMLSVSLEKARLKFVGFNGFAHLERVVSALLKDERLKPFFFCSDACVYQEKEIMDFAGHMKRIDRLIVGKTHVDVIDYKSSKDVSGRDREQIQEYLHIVASLYPDKKRRGVLVFLDDLSMEEVNG